MHFEVSQNRWLQPCNAYDSFGNLIASSGTAANTYGFTGEQQFGEADNLVFLRARYYNPSVGRFISRDPIGYKGGLNLYAYVKNNPIMFRDPSGKRESSLCYILGFYGIGWGVITGNCPYICQDFEIDNCGNIHYLGPSFHVVPLSVIPGYNEFCPIKIGIRDDILPPGWV